MAKGSKRERLVLWRKHGVNDEEWIEGQYGFDKEVNATAAAVRKRPIIDGTWELVEVEVRRRTLVMAEATVTVKVLDA